MKYVKSFNDILKEGNNVNRTLMLESILRLVFDSFLDEDMLKTVWKNVDISLLEKIIEVYKHLINLNDILVLPTSQQQKYAKNLGINIEKTYDIIFEISNQLYVNLYNKYFIDDINYLLEEFEKRELTNKQKEFVKYLKEIKKLL